MSASQTLAYGRLQSIAFRVLALIGAFVVAMQIVKVAVGVVVLLAKSPLALIGAVLLILLTAHHRRRRVLI